ncbi:MAG: nucleoside deaminase [Lacrimispora sp.]
MISNVDMKYLKRCVELAETALEKGNAPFGSVLVAANGELLAEEHNRIGTGDHTQHPEFALARWAAENMTPEERSQATVYTSGEHCPMCAAAHGWVGLGRIVYACSCKQLAGWLDTMGVEPSRVKSLPIQDIIRDTTTDGPVPELEEQVRELHRLFHTKGR